MTNLKKKTIASATALMLAASLSACDTDDDPNDGTIGGTDAPGIVTTTSIPGDFTTTTGADDMTTTTAAP